MTIRLVIFVVLACLVIDALVRRRLKRFQVDPEQLERERCLANPVRLAFSEEVASLQRVEVPHPKARILAVDDEKVVLDALRRVLVLEGYSSDTVQTGPEALSLLRRNDYDFLFTDLRMPDMDGVEVIRAAKHLRPDVDVVVITAYGTIETAVEAMSSGACEYLQKPFSADELAAHLDKLLARRRARLRAVRQPSPRSGASVREDPGPAGAFIADGHAWAWIEPDGQVRIGIDAFAGRVLGGIGEVLLPEPGLEIRRGEPLFGFRRGAEELRFLAPVSGKVQDSNGSLLVDPSRVSRSPYGDGWICRMDSNDLTRELGQLRIGRPALDWNGRELDRFQAVHPDPAQPPSWATLAREFFSVGSPHPTV
jgi:CheY-like chemotaxis protein/glycine cleavage system H lipoate-binding protein